MMIKLHLPFPISVNRLYPGKARRHKSHEYELWIINAKLMLNQQNLPLSSISYPVQITYRIGQPDKRRRDIANLEKSLSDVLVEHKILKDDSLIHRLVMEWADVDGVDVEIRPLERR